MTNKTEIKEIRNLDGRKICVVDPQAKTVIIVTKGVETQIVFKDDGSFILKERKISA